MSGKNNVIISIDDEGKKHLSDRSGREFFWEPIEFTEKRIKFGVYKQIRDSSDSSWILTADEEGYVRGIVPHKKRLVKSYWADNPFYKEKKTNLPDPNSLRGKIRKAIIKRRGEDPEDSFKIESLNRKKHTAEVYIVWDEIDKEIIGVEY